MDALASLFSHVPSSASTFFAGKLCSNCEYGGTGHLHFLKSGALILGRDGADDARIDAPALIFFPRGLTHRFKVDAQGGADLVCATVDLGSDKGNPIGSGLPDFILIDLAKQSELATICELLIAEADSEACGQRVAIDYLFGYLLVKLVRHVVDNGAVEFGVLSGLANPKLARALTAIHDNPARNWSLQDLADEAGMSRTRFAVLFREIVGVTAMDYLTSWRISSAQALLRQGKPVKAVIRAVGYDSASAFTRRFVQQIGLSPRDWLAAISAQEAEATAYHRGF